ncbi:MAG: tetratricopeptide repeat protein [Spirochaetales bacterium]|nr:tetratricopeptide repeat protein [Spirochaetales bacterium]
MTLFVGLSVIVSAVAQSPDPAWLQIRRADKLAADGDYGIAIQLYREALTLDPGSPEAIFGLARAFKSISDYPIAEEYLLEALAAAEDLMVPAVRYEINYELAGLYKVQRRFADYERVLFQTVDLAAGEPATPRSVDVPADTLQTVLINDGLDRVLVLYRLQEDGGTRARGELAELLVGLGRYDEAAEQGLVAITQQLSTVIEAVIERDPGYEYQTVLGALTHAEIYPETRAYLADTSLYENLYFLAGALYARGNPESAVSLWRLLPALPRAGDLSNRARIQLADPQPEPLLVPPR